MREETDAIRTYYNADPRKEWDRLMKKHPYEKYITVHNIYIWPDGDTPKRIYEEGGFRVMETRKAGRAVFEANGNKTRC